MKRAERRNQETKIKQKIKRILKEQKRNVTEEVIGKLASVHGAKCSCGVCGNPRKYSKHKLTLQEIKQNNKLRDELTDNT